MFCGPLAKKLTLHQRFLIFWKSSWHSNDVLSEELQPSFPWNDILGESDSQVGSGLAFNNKTGSEVHSGTTFGCKTDSPAGPGTAIFGTFEHQVGPGTSVWDETALWSTRRAGYNGISSFPAVVFPAWRPSR